jgi:hypothetical protein
MTGVDLSGLELNAINLTNTNLTGVNLNRAKASRANLSGANLSNANMQSANLSGARMLGANLSAANISDAILIGADLIGALSRNVHGAHDAKVDGTTRVSSQSGSFTLEGTFSRSYKLIEGSRLNILLSSAYRAETFAWFGFVIKKRQQHSSWSFCDTCPLCLFSLFVVCRVRMDLDDIAKLLEDAGIAVDTIPPQDSSMPGTLVCRSGRWGFAD